MQSQLPLLSDVSAPAPAADGARSTSAGRRSRPSRRAGGGSTATSGGIGRGRRGSLALDPATRARGLAGVAEARRALEQVPRPEPLHLREAS